MSDVIVERHWDPPLTAADMQRMAELAEDCYGIHRVEWCSSLLSTDGAEMFCHFRAPDAESVRIALRQAGSPIADVWSCTVRDAPQATGGDLAAVNVVATHRFDSPPDATVLEALEQSAVGLHDGRRECLLRTYVSNDRRRMLCLYHAPNPGSVLRGQRAAGLLPEAVWEVRRFAP